MGEDGKVNPYAPPKAESLVLPDDDKAPLDATQDEAEEKRWKWTTVASFGTPEKAVDALRRLEDAKISCRVLNDGTIDSSMALHWVRSMPLGGHRVQVYAADLAEAAAVLGVAVEPDEYQVEPVNPADERMRKALLVATLGTFVCLGFAQLVALGMILATPSNALSAVGRRHRRWAGVVSVLILGGIAYAMTDDATPHYDLLPRSVSPNRLPR
jgi:hypothetical protein